MRPLICLTHDPAGCPLIAAVEDSAAPRSAHSRGGRRSEVPRPDQSLMAVSKPDGGCRPCLTCRFSEPWDPGFSEPFPPRVPHRVTGGTSPTLPPFVQNEAWA